MQNPQACSALPRSEMSGAYPRRNFWGEFLCSVFLGKTLRGNAPDGVALDKPKYPPQKFFMNRNLREENKGNFFVSIFDCMIPVLEYQNLFLAFF